MKDNRQVEEFLRNLSVKFGVFELTDLETRHWLHPTSYTFNFRDSSSAEHSFKYMIDCSNHLDERYKRLVEAFDDFFELERISKKFYEQEQQKEAQERQERAAQERAKKRWWKF